MAKFKLDLDRIKVESFTTQEPANRRGTVFANGSDWGLCGGYDPTEYVTCNGQPTDDCVYATHVQHSCPADFTDNDHTCNDPYPHTDVRICCSEACTGDWGMC